MYTYSSYDILSQNNAVSLKRQGFERVLETLYTRGPT